MVRITLEYQGRRVDVIAAGSWPDIEYMWTEGACACDCNRSIEARRAGADWPELPCGSDQIEIVVVASDAGSPVGGWKAVIDSQLTEEEMADAWKRLDEAMGLPAKDAADKGAA